MKLNKLFLAVLVCLLSFSMLSFAATDKETFVFVSIGAGPDTLDPALAYDNASGEVLFEVYDNLLEYDGSNTAKLLPMLATEVPSVENGLISKDGKTVKFNLRKDIKFHDGTALTASDVKYSLIRNMLLDPDGGPNWMLLEPILGVNTIQELVQDLGGGEDVTKADAKVLRQVYDLLDKAIITNANQITFKLKTAYAPFLNIMAHSSSWSIIYSKDWAIKNGAWDGKPDTWVKWYNQSKEQMALFERANGTGPFKLKVWDKNARKVVLERNDNYWRKPAAFKTVELQYIDEFSTRKVMLQKGDADAIYVPLNYLDQVQNIPGITVIDHVPTLTNTAGFFNFNIDVKGNDDVGSGKLDGNGIPSDFFSDINVRKGFLYSFDWDAFIKEVMMDRASKPTGCLPGALPFANPKQETYSLNAAKATEAFKKAFDGELWKKGFKMTISYNSGNTMRQTAAEILQYNITKLNPKFKVEVRAVQWATLLDNLRSGRTTFFFMGWIPDFPDAHNFATPYMHSTGTFAGYCGESMQKLAASKYDPLIAKGIAATSEAERQEIYNQLQKLAYEDAIQLYMSDNEVVRVFKSELKGFYPSAVRPGEYDIYKLYK